MTSFFDSPRINKAKYHHISFVAQKQKAGRIFCWFVVSFQFPHARSRTRTGLNLFQCKPALLGKAWFTLVAGCEGPFAANNWKIFYFYCNGLQQSLVAADSQLVWTSLKVSCWKTWLDVTLLILFWTQCTTFIGIAHVWTFEMWGSNLICYTNLSTIPNAFISCFQRQKRHWMDNSIDSAWRRWHHWW